MDIDYYRETDFQWGNADMDLKDIQIWIWIQIDTNTRMNFETIMNVAY